MLRTRRTRKIMRRLDAWAGNAAYMADHGNMIMFSVYLDRITETLWLLKDLGIMTEAEVEKLLAEYVEYWANVTSPDRWD